MIPPFFLAGTGGVEPTGWSFGGSTAPGARPHDGLPQPQTQSVGCREEAALPLVLVGEKGFEPPRPEASVSKTGVSSNFTTLPHLFRGRATITLVPQEGF